MEWRYVEMEICFTGSLETELETHLGEFDSFTCMLDCHTVWIIYIYSSFWFDFQLISC